MYRLLAFILTVCLCLTLTACTRSPATVDLETVTETSATKGTTIPTDPTPEKAKSDSFGLTLDELAQVLEKSNVLEDFVTYETERYTVHRTGHGTDGALLFSSPGSDKIEVALFLSYSGASRYSNDTQAAIYAKSLLCEYCKSNGIEYVAEEIEQEHYLVFAVYALDSTLDNFPLSIRHLRSEYEFFANEDRVETFSSLMYSCKYHELRSYIAAFVAEGNCPQNDIAHILVTKLDELIPFMDDCYVEVDGVEKSTSIIYKDVTEITRQINVLPVVEISDFGASLDITLGFIKDEWLFFDRVYFASASTETEYFSLGNTTTDVLSDGSILESSSIGGSAMNALMEICESSSPVIRFANSKTDEYIDHELSPEEIDALLRLKQVRDLHDEIWDSLGIWEDA